MLHLLCDLSPIVSFQKILFALPYNGYNSCTSKTIGKAIISSPEITNLLAYLHYLHQPTYHQLLLCGNNILKIICQTQYCFRQHIEVLPEHYKLSELGSFRNR
jgi:hypothetical protein